MGFEGEAKRTPVSLKEKWWANVVSEWIIKKKGEYPNKPTSTSEWSQDNHNSHDSII